MRYGKFIRAYEKAVRVGADERLVTKTRAIGMVLRTVRPFVRKIELEQVKGLAVHKRGSERRPYEVETRHRNGNR